MITSKEKWKKKQKQMDNGNNRYRENIRGSGRDVLACVNRDDPNIRERFDFRFRLYSGP